jgi:hypothetical protein
MIRPEFWTDGKIIECSVSARLLFIGTWTYADDNGNIDACIKQLLMQVFPGDANIDVKMVASMLDELITHGLLIPYSVNGNIYLNIKNFLKHQKINRPSPSSRPKFDESLVLTEYSMSTQPEVKRSEVKERSKSRTSSKTTSKDASKRVSEYTEDFQKFWSVYPRKLCKQVAFESYRRIVPQYPPDDVIESAREYADQCAKDQREEKFILHPATFLNKGRWKDYCFDRDGPREVKEKPGAMA